jgi:hypothetical protein
LHEQGAVRIVHTVTKSDGTRGESGEEEIKLHMMIVDAAVASLPVIDSSFNRICHESVLRGTQTERANEQ